LLSHLDVQSCTDLTVTLCIVYKDNGSNTWHPSPLIYLNNGLHTLVHVLLFYLVAL